MPGGISRPIPVAHALTIRTNGAAIGRKIPEPDSREEAPLTSEFGDLGVDLGKNRRVTRKTRATGVYEIEDKNE